MACNCHTYGLLYLLVVQELPNALSCLVSVHDGHVAVHEYEFVSRSLIIVVLYIIFDYLQSFDAIVCFLTNLFYDNFNVILELYFECLMIEELVIHYENFVELNIYRDVACISVIVVESSDLPLIHHF